jgi:hypothetical protein
LCIWRVSGVRREGGPGPQVLDSDDSGNLVFKEICCELKKLVAPPPPSTNLLVSKNSLTRSPDRQTPPPHQTSLKNLNPPPLS